MGHDDGSHGFELGKLSMVLIYMYMQIYATQRGGSYRPLSTLIEESHWVLDASLRQSAITKACFTAYSGCSTRNH